MPSEWFNHDVTASSDPKILNLEVQFGEAGYARYFKTLEWLYMNADASVDTSDDGSFDHRPLARHLRLTEKETCDFVDHCLRFGLLEIDDGSLFSDRLREQKRKQLEKSEQARKAVEARERKRKQRKGKPGLSDDTSDDTSDVHRGEERRGEERRGETTVDHRIDNVEYLFSEFQRMSKRHKTILNAKRKKAIRARLKEFSMEEIRKAWAEMAVHPFLRGENDRGQDYFTLDYATRFDRIEFYLNQYSQKHGS